MVDILLHCSGCEVQLLAVSPLLGLAVERVEIVSLKHIKGEECLLPHSWLRRWTIPLHVCKGWVKCIPLPPMVVFKIMSENLTM